MARIVLHAGMGKAGSTSIQEWMRAHREALRGDAGIVPVVATVDAAARVQVAPHRSGTMNSPTVMRRVMDRPEDRATVFDSFVRQLDEAAAAHGAVVLSAEIFGRAIALGDEDLVQRMERLASAHEVTVAYYVRPQHEALESGWRHWRSTREKVPSEYVARLDRELHHLATISFMRRLAPSVAFAVRPCRADLLHRGSTVSDFARIFLDLDAHEITGGQRENRGVPLGVANALSSMPLPDDWAPDQDHRFIELVKRALGDEPLPESPRAELSRLVLRQACHDRYEADNRTMVDDLGWETATWVPPVDEEIGDASFERLDELWQPDANATELALLQRALVHGFLAERDLRRLRSSRSVRAALRVRAFRDFARAPRRS